MSDSDSDNEAPEEVCTSRQREEIAEPEVPSKRRRQQESVARRVAASKQRLALDEGGHDDDDDDDAAARARGGLAETPSSVCLPRREVRKGVWLADVSTPITPFDSPASSSAAALLLRRQTGSKPREQNTIKLSSRTRRR